MVMMTVTQAALWRTGNDSRPTHRPRQSEFRSSAIRIDALSHCFTAFPDRSGAYTWSEKAL